MRVATSGVEAWRATRSSAQGGEAWGDDLKRAACCAWRNGVIGLSARLGGIPSSRTPAHLTQSLAA